MKQQTNNPHPSASRPWAKWLAVAGLLLILTATAMPLFRFQGDVFRYLYAAGALSVFIGRLFNPCPSDNLRVRRLYRIEVWAGVIFCAGAFFMFYKRGGAMDWMAFTLAGGVIEAYASIMIPKAREASHNGSGKR